MAGRQVIAPALRSIGRSEPIESLRPLSGGCIHQATLVTLRGGDTLVVKCGREAAPLFHEEALGLNALAATRTIPVPQPLGVWEDGDAAALLMTYVPPAPATERSWRRLGEELAALHQSPAGERYGFHIDNHLGLTPQPNAWCDDWVEFNRRHRLGFQIERADAAGLLLANEVVELRHLLDRLDHLLPRRPRPALLHGDLWSGNALPTLDERVAVIDPAPSVGDGWADIAMMRLFGGFPHACLDAYAQCVDDHEDVDTRIAVYQLYHLLNHLNLFGRGYAGQVMEIVRRLR